MIIWLIWILWSKCWDWETETRGITEGREHSRDKMDTRIIKPCVSHEEVRSRDDLAEGTSGLAVRWGSGVRVFTPVPLLREQGSPPPSFLPVQWAWTRLSFGSVSRIQFVSYIIIQHRNYISNATQISITQLKSKPYLQCYY